MIMALRDFVTQLVTAMRELVWPSYRPELHYMRGPGPAYARVAVRARNAAGR
jgi:hypothetical protein